MHRKANIRIPQAVFKRAFGPWAEFWQAKESPAWSHSMCYELYLILWLSRKLSKKKVGRLFSWVFLLLFFCARGLNHPRMCFSSPSWPRPGRYFPRGSAAPKGVTRVQSSLVPLGMFGLLPTSVFWAPYLSFSFWNLLTGLFLYYCNSWICSVSWYGGKCTMAMLNIFF